VVWNKAASEGCSRLALLTEVLAAGGKMRKECILPVAPSAIAGDRWQPHLSLEHCLRGFTDAIDAPGQGCRKGAEGGRPKGAEGGIQFTRGLLMSFSF
jgi:hypothetical protein